MDLYICCISCVSLHSCVKLLIVPSHPPAIFTMSAFKRLRSSLALESSCQHQEESSDTGCQPGSSGCQPGSSGCQPESSGCQPEQPEAPGDSHSTSSDEEDMPDQ